MMETMTSLAEQVKETVRDIPNFPKEGIIFKDITPILQNPVLCNDIVEHIIHQFKDTKIDAIACIESRGFLFGPLIAQKLSIPFIPIRKKGKLPYKTISYKYDLEYGSAEIEMHEDAIQKGWNVLIHDDLLATGGTAAAAAELVQHTGNVAGFSFLINLDFLNGKEVLTPYNSKVESIIEY